MPNGIRHLAPPTLSGRLAGVRDKAVAGDFTSGWSLRWTQTFHPGHELGGSR